MSIFIGGTSLQRSEGGGGDFILTPKKLAVRN
jgi:hypothetical protein